MKVDKYHFPVIIVTALVLFFVLALILGFTPAH
jgi:hypothetical protein